MLTRFRRLILSALAAAAALTLAPSTTEAATTYRVVGTGDSILAMSYGFAGPGGVINTSSRWLDLEHGRNAFSAGMAGRASTASIWPLLLQRSQPGGWVVISDNGLGTSDSAWRTLMTRIVDELPDDRCLLGVLSGYIGQHSAEVARRASVMGQEFRRQPCRAFVYLNAYMTANPGNFPDGQHPDATARAWIKSSITAWTG